MMYESPITRFAEDIMTDIVKREEGYLVESVHKVGFDIDKEELAKALRYDRDQYEKGFNDGRLAASPRWIPVTERLPEYGAKCLVTAHAPDIDRLIIITSRCYVQKEGFWTDLPFTYKVTAWLPLPEPWEGEADGQH